MKFYPEGNLPDNPAPFKSMEEINNAIKQNSVVEAKVLLCDREHNLHVDLGAARGIILREAGAIGIDDGSVRDIALISKVNKSVCFNILGFKQDIYNNKIAVLSRKAVQIKCMNEYISRLKVGDIIDARVTHLEKFGAFIDIGAGINALIPIDMLSVSRISHPCERLKENDNIKVILRKIEPNKLTFSLKELLGTWEENASNIEVGETVTGVVRSIEEYGVFIELAPNLAGLAEHQEGLFIGQSVAVYVKSIIPEKMKVKLVIVEAFNETAPPRELVYYHDGDNMSYWNYSPSQSAKQIFTNFKTE